MPVTTYTSVNGSIYSENRGGTIKEYRPDTLGSTAALVQQNGTVSDTFEYWPYGEEASRTGSTPTPFRFVGTLGYYKDAGSSGLTYVRARHYAAKLARWITVDPLWPDDDTYRYALNNPITHIDPLGKWPSYVGCSRDVVNKINSLCARLYFMSNQDQYLINRCIEAAAKKISIDCQGITENRKKSVARWCDEDGTLICGPIPSTGGKIYGQCPGTGPWNMDRDDPSDEIDLNLIPPYGNTYAKWLYRSGGQVTVLHELMHACGQQHNNSDLTRQCNDIQACCIFEVLVNGNDGHRCVNRI